MPTTNLNAFERRLLNDFQQDMPLSPTPYADMAARLGVSEAEVLEALTSLREQGVVSRVGPVLATNRVGASTLAAMAVPEPRLEAVARLVSEHPAVNHNYEREHRFNLWFVATAPGEAELARVITELEQATGLDALVLPMIQDYHIDLGFELQWN
ncbi:MAG: Lrp/AsnC family transcriptional regulator [Gammaproteobacteria bacterium]|nr:Lrp/AsnC family transcriptional regulator [Gammaproteobacteria bacterium]MCW9059328.1 Lrp/AsnC family transcriptional regulator [Gammaproteobacteria bacterium]